MTYIGFPRKVSQRDLRVINRQFGTPNLMHTMVISIIKLEGDPGVEVPTRRVYMCNMLFTNDWSNMPQNQEVPDFVAQPILIPPSVAGQVTNWVNIQDPTDTDLPTLRNNLVLAMPETVTPTNFISIQWGFFTTVPLDYWENIYGVQVRSGLGLPIKLLVQANNQDGTQYLYQNLLLPKTADYGIKDVLTCDMKKLNYIRGTQLDLIVVLYDSDDYDLRMNAYVFEGDNLQMGVNLSPRFRKDLLLIIDYHTLFDVPKFLSIGAAALAAGINSALTTEVISLVGSDPIIAQELAVLGIAGAQAMLVIGAALTLRSAYGYDNLVENLTDPSRIVDWLRNGFDPKMVAATAAAGFGVSSIMTSGPLAAVSGAGQAALVSLLMTALDDMSYELDFEDGLSD